MRTYAPNSPEAATRLLAMALIADGHCSMSEIRTLDRLGAPDALGLTAEQAKQVIDDFCADLLLGAQGDWAASTQIDAGTRRQLMAEVSDPVLGSKVRHLCEAIMLSDGHLADGEIELLDALAATWPRAATEQALPERLAA
jgi:uncharacterized tellurite resistance protein B-like protein